MTALADAVTATIVAAGYEAPATPEAFARILDAVVNQHPHLEPQVVMHEIIKRFVAAAQDSIREVDALKAYAAANTIDGIECFTGVLTFECVRCSERASVPAVIVKMRPRVLCDDCQRKHVLEGRC